MTEFNQSVFDAAGAGDEAKLQEALASHGHLIDTPTPFEPHRTPIHHAAISGHVKIIEMLVRFGSQALDAPDSAGQTPLNSAFQSAHAVAVIEALVRLGSQALDMPDKGGMTPMHHAALMDCSDGIEKLVRLGCRSIDAEALHG